LLISRGIPLVSPGLTARRRKARAAFRAEPAIAAVERGEVRIILENRRKVILEYKGTQSAPSIHLLRLLG